MASEKNNMILNLVGLIVSLILMVTSVLSFGLAGQLSYYIYAVFDTSVWDDDTKYVDGNATTGIETDIYAKAVIQRDADLVNIQKTLKAGGLIAGLTSLVVVIAVFFRKDGGLIAMFKGN